MTTHEQYIDAVVRIALARLNANDRARFDNVKIVYGSGPTGARGVTWYNTWRNGSDDAHPFVEICAFAETSPIQIAGTVIHEMAHVIAGWGAGHGPMWVTACGDLGLRCVRAAGTNYMWSHFHPLIRAQLYRLSPPTDGTPVRPMDARGRPIEIKPCTAGIGTRGGTSRGTGSGSRLVKCVCGTCGYTVRTTQKWIAVGVPKCPADGAPIEPMPF